ncbi:hypothetical protein [Thiobacillus denitrificans]|nr:hypothetical protein [Thiobacillus denitrificans]
MTNHIPAAVPCPDPGSTFMEIAAKIIAAEETARKEIRRARAQIEASNNERWLAEKRLDFAKDELADVLASIDAAKARLASIQALTAIEADRVLQALNQEEFHA